MTTPSYLLLGSVCITCLLEKLWYANIVSLTNGFLASSNAWSRALLCCVFPSVYCLITYNFILLLSNLVPPLVYYYSILRTYHYRPYMCSHLIQSSNLSPMSYSYIQYHVFLSPLRRCLNPTRIRTGVSVKIAKLLTSVNMTRVHKIYEKMMLMMDEMGNLDLERQNRLANEVFARMLEMNTKNVSTSSYPLFHSVIQV